MIPDDLELVLVHWVDIQGDAGWGSTWEHEGTLAKCVEVGWVVHRDKGKLTLARGLCNPDTAERVSGAYVTIPMVNVTLIQRLAVVPVTG